MKFPAATAVILCTLSPLLNGCGFAGHTAYTPAFLGTAATAVVLQSQSTGPGAQSPLPNSLLRFGAGATGSAAPAAVLQLDASFRDVLAVHVDPFGNIYVAGDDAQFQPLILEYASGAAGAEQPVRRITLTTPNSFYPGAITTDAAGTLYVATYDAIAVVPLGAATPARTIYGPATTLYEIDGIAVDADGTIYVTNDTVGPGTVVVFAATANGNAAPAQVISGIGASVLSDPSGIAIAPNGHVFLSAFTGPGQGVIFDLGPHPTGSSVTPLSTVQGGYYGFISLQFDAASNLYTLFFPALPGAAGGVGPPSLSTYKPTPGGAYALQSTFSSPSWTFPGYGQFGLD